jgi:hypothetical protein
MPESTPFSESHRLSLRHSLSIISRAPLFQLFLGSVRLTDSDRAAGRNPERSNETLSDDGWRNRFRPIVFSQRTIYYRVRGNVSAKQPTMSSSRATSLASITSTIKFERVCGPHLRTKHVGGRASLCRTPPCHQEAASGADSDDAVEASDPDAQ